jgi:hypothetical protein
MALGSGVGDKVRIMLKKPLAASAMPLQEGMVFSLLLNNGMEA